MRDKSELWRVCGKNTLQWLSKSQMKLQTLLENCLRLLNRKKEIEWTKKVLKKKFKNFKINGGLLKKTLQ